MRIGIIGASGNIGTRLRAEALERGHAVVAFTRQGAAGHPVQDGVEWQDLDILDLEGVTRAVQGLDVLVSSFQPGNAARDLADAVRQAIADPAVYKRAAKVLLKALESRPALRLIVVGGAASLEVAPGVTADQDEAGLREALRHLGLPEAYVAAIQGHKEALDTLRLSNRRWTYVSPAVDVRAGERTGRFRVGGDQLLVEADGRSWITYEDLAAAILDEIEWPLHIQRRFSVAY